MRKLHLSPSPALLAALSRFHTAQSTLDRAEKGQNPLEGSGNETGSGEVGVISPTQQKRTPGQEDTSTNREEADAGREVNPAVRADALMSGRRVN